MDPDASIPGDPAPSVFNYVLSFLLVGVAWGFTTPFIRRAAADFNARQERQKQSTTTTTTSATPSPSSPSSDRISLDRGRSQAQSPNSGAEDAQELLPTSEPDVIDLGDLDGGNEVRRRSGSRQREEEQELEYGEPSGHSHRDGHDHVVQQESDTGGIPAPAWMHSSARQSWVRTKIVSVFWTVVNLLRTPAYSIPLVINLTGSIWFFLLVGKHGTFQDWRLVKCTSFQHVK